MSTLQDAVAQEIWQCYVVEVGHALPEGMADKLAAAVVNQLELYEERRLNVMSSGGQTTDYKTGITTVHSDYRYDTRIVSNWKTEKP